MVVVKEGQGTLIYPRHVTTAGARRRRRRKDARRRFKTGV